MPFLVMIGFFGLVSLIPFVIIYLRKPRPKDRIIPSLMFLLRDQKESNQSQFLQRFLVNALFFIQLLAFVLLAVALAQPFITLPYDVSLENTIIVIDASASMQANENVRFEKAVYEAQSKLSGKNSIILAEHIPLLVLEDETAETARGILVNLQPKATTTNLGDAMLLAKDVLGERPGKIIVISDFNAVANEDLLVVKRTIVDEDKVVEFVDVSVPADNVGIVDAEIRKHSIKLFVKNFNNEKKTVSLAMKKDNKVLATSGSFEIMPESLETFLFDDTPAGTSTIELEQKDGLRADNVLYISAPLKKKIDVLLITNKPQSHIENALTANPDVNLNIVNPPVLTLNTKGQRIDTFGQDIIIVHEINNVGQRNGILPGTFSDLSTYAKNGGKLILTAQENFDKIDTADLALLNIRGLITDKPDKACVSVVNEITKYFESEQCFASVIKYFDATARKDIVTLATIHEVPLIGLKDHGKGKTFFYGIIDEQSDFKTLPSYPIFWNDVLMYMAGSENIQDFNVLTGSIALIPEQSVKTPSGSITTSRILFDEAGFYHMQHRTVAANLLNEKESSITKGSTLDDDSESGDVLKEHANQKQLGLSALVLILLFLILCFEIWYIKRRGDI